MLGVHPMRAAIAAPPAGGAPTFVNSATSLIATTNPWTLLYTPAVGSTLVLFPLQSISTQTISSITVSPNELSFAQQIYVPPAGTSTQMSGYGFIAATNTSSAVQHTITINWSGNANGVLFLHEWSPAQLAAGQTANGQVNLNGHAVPAKHRPDAVTATDISVSVGIFRRSTGLGFSAMGGAWVRVDTGSSAQYASHYRENWSPTGLIDDSPDDSRGAIPVGDGRDNVGIYIPLESQ